MTDNTSGVLILSHCGYSFLEDLKAELDRRQLKCFVLSSLPLPEHVPQRLDHLRGWADALHSTTSHQLQASDVDACIDTLHDQGEHVLCCISVWEGYRHLMAYANGRLGIHDLDWEHTLQLRNKLAVRNRLADAGLSAVRAIELSPVSLALLKEDDKRYFIKPIHGIASYGAFPLRENTTWAGLEGIRACAAKDTLYASAFNGPLSFMAEHYIAGREFSFEVLVVDGNAHVVAIHEKCEMTESADTVLENCCTSPPVSLAPDAIAEGVAWIGKVVDEVRLNWGCFHIEARFTGKAWDLIEINPRVGGSLISHSVNSMTQGQSLLSLWLELLIFASADDANARRTFERYLAEISYTSNGVCPSDIATFFRVYFAEAGVLEHVEIRPLAMDPVVSHVLLKPGDEIPAQAREVFLGQMLWAFARNDHRQTFTLLSQLSAQAIDIRYAKSRQRQPGDNVTCATH